MIFMKPIIQIKHGTLSKSVRKAISMSFTANTEHRRTYLAAQQVILKKLNLSPVELKKAIAIEKQSTRLLEAITLIEGGGMINTATALAIIKNTKDKIPGYIERNKTQLSPQNIQALNALQANLEKDLTRIDRKRAARLPTILSPSFLENARVINFDELKAVLGTKKFDAYMRAYGRVIKVFVRRGEKLEELAQKIHWQ